MKIILSDKEKKVLELAHRRERDARVCDRIKAVLLRSEGWSCRQIAQALRIHDETVRTHLSDWQVEQKLTPANGGSDSHLTCAQTEALIVHLEQSAYTKAADICQYVQQLWEVKYTVSGMTQWLHSHAFSYKLLKGVPAKADALQQAAFIDEYTQLKASAGADEPIIFIDSVHPTMATKISHGWIHTGKEKQIRQTASRTRENIIGGIELNQCSVVTTHHKTVNAESIIEFFTVLKATYSNATKLHVILDQAGYHRSEVVRTFAKNNGIELHYLPPYSPNLNPIERLWKFMNEQIRNNRFFASAKEFRKAIRDFFRVKIPELKEALKSRITDNFQVIKNPAS